MANWKNAAKSIKAVELASFLIVASVAAQGVYKRQNTIKQKALKEVKPIAFKASENSIMPALDEELTTPKSTAQLETTTSFAEIPAINARVICQNPKPTGAKRGAKILPRLAPKL